MNKIELNTAEGYPICLNIFTPLDGSKLAAIIVPATGVKQSYYQKFANFLAEKNIIAITFDYGGIGESKKQSLKKFNTSAYNWGHNDLEQVMLYVKKNYADKKIALIGHSIGGQLIGLSPSSTCIDFIILIAAQTGYWKYWKGFSKIKMILNWYLLFPTLTKLYGYMPSSKISSMEDLPKAVANQWSKWCLSPNYLFDHLPQQKLFYTQIKCPIISYSSKDDNYAPKKAVDWLTNKYDNAKIKRIHLNPAELNLGKIGHFGFFKSNHQSQIWSMFLNDLYQSKRKI